MERITVSKEKVAEALLKNKSNHIAMHAEAYDGWKVDRLDYLKLVAERIEKDDVVAESIYLQPPRSRAKEYDTAINMLSYHIGDTVELTRQEFVCFIEDDWDWQADTLRNFARNSRAAASYATSKGIELR